MFFSGFLEKTNFLCLYEISTPRLFAVSVCSHRIDSYFSPQYLHFFKCKGSPKSIDHFSRVLNNVFASSGHVAKSRQSSAKHRCVKILSFTMMGAFSVTSFRRSVRVNKAAKKSSPDVVAP